MVVTLKKVTADCNILQYYDPSFRAQDFPCSHDAGVRACAVIAHAAILEIFSIETSYTRANLRKIFFGGLLDKFQIYSV